MLGLQEKTLGGWTVFRGISVFHDADCLRFSAPALRFHGVALHGAVDHLRQARESAGQGGFREAQMEGAGHRVTL